MSADIVRIAKLKTVVNKNPRTGKDSGKYPLKVIAKSLTTEFILDYHPTDINKKEIPCVRSHSMRISISYKL